mmetsp:Transcript_75839/g.149959  ORF Transcript_75839/g.149959 Transcript_75839/m.149959 type:complete len:454 (-) Transcript_75839:68-1429(-)
MQHLSVPPVQRPHAGQVAPATDPPSLKDLQEEEARLLKQLQHIQRTKTALISRATNFQEIDEEDSSCPESPETPLLQEKAGQPRTVRLRSADAAPGTSLRGFRTLPPLPNRVASQHFQGHGSDMVVIEDGIAAQNNEILNVPSIRDSFAFSVVFTLGYTIYLLTAWWKCTSDWDEIFPKCEQTNTLVVKACEGSCILFWTAPICYCALVVIYLYQDMLCCELYYAMLGHNVMIDYEHASFFQSYPVLFLFLWQFGGLGIYIFNWDHFFVCFMRTLPYWIPIVSASSMLCCTWDVEYRLITLSNYVSRNFEDALHHVGSCLFLRDYIVKAGLRSLQRGRGFRTKAGMGISIQDIVQEIENLETQGKLKDAKPDIHDNHFWMSEIIYVLNHPDERSVSFRFWFRIYRCYTILMLSFLIGLWLSTQWRHDLNRNHPVGGWKRSWLNAEDRLGSLIA